MNAVPSAILIHRNTLLRVLCLIILLLAGAHLAGLTMKQLGHERVFGLVRLFDMDEERNIPTLYSTCLFLLNGALCLAVWRLCRLKGTPHKTWLLLSCILLFLAVDEFCQIHEYLKKPTKELLHTSGGFFGPAWVIPYGIAVIVLFATLIPFFLRQEKVTRRLLALSAVIFLIGAVGVEMLAGHYIEVSRAKHGEEFNMYVDLRYGLSVAVEESLEMLGLVVLSYALIRHIEKAHGGLTVVLAPRPLDESRGNK